MLWVVLILCPIEGAAQVSLTNAPLTTTEVTLNKFPDTITGQTFASFENEPFALVDPGGGGSTEGMLSAQIETFSDRIEMHVDGVITTADLSIFTGMAGTFSVEIPVPNLGDAHTELYLTVDVTESTPGLTTIRALGPSFNHFTSASLPHRVSLPENFGFVSDSLDPLQMPEQFSFAAPAGDTVQMDLQWNWAGQILPGDLGPFSATLVVAFKVPPPSLGSGDLNGDFLLDIADVTIARRRLAGFPAD